VQALFARGQPGLAVLEDDDRAVEGLGAGLSRFRLEFEELQPPGERADPLLRTPPRHQGP
jgi:hypothetical protein